MNSVKNGVLLLALGVPFALYVAWQVRTAGQLDAGPSAPPTDAGLTKDQLAKSGTEATNGAAESRRAVEGAWRSSAAEPASKSPRTPGDATAQAAAARVADLADLEKFLSGVERPAFVGGLKSRYDDWTRERSAAVQAEGAVKAWLRKPPQIGSVADADKALDEAAKLVGEYAGRSRFANKSRAAEWRLQARLKLVDALAALADLQYGVVVRAKLPLESAGSTAVATLRGLKAHLDALDADFRQTEDDKVPLAAAFRAALEGKRGSADEYTAREELLALFAKDDLFTNAAGAEAWLKQVAEQYAKTKDAKVRALIRDKVQQFADGFIPPEVSLDEHVLVEGKLASRKDVVIKSQASDGKGKDEGLSDRLSGTNEFNFEKKYPGDNTFVLFDGREDVPAVLKPTDLSKAAAAYSTERAKPAERAAPRWTAKSVEVLKNQCEKQRELVDQLRTPGAGVAGAAPKIATRVLGLAAGAAAHKELFEPAP